MKYEQASGKLFDEHGLIGVGWAGHSAGRNNPAMQDVKDVGPLPIGFYTIEDPVSGTHLGPLAFPLTPDPSNQMFGRGGFYIHGAEQLHPEMSSDGCIIQGRAVREYIDKKIGATSKDDPVRKLQVV